MLTVQGLSVNHGAVQALRSVDFCVPPGQVLTVLGRNGSGRSTLARALMGLTPAQGRVLWMGQDLLGLEPHQIARLGVGYVPETRDVFSLLSVEQNLQLGLRGKPGRDRIAWAYEQFPQLHARRQTLAGLLSGGEQQMLSLIRSLLARPRLLIVDEPAEGLAPQMVQAVAHLMRQQVKAGTAIVLMEQKLDLALDLADRVLLLGRSEVVFEGTPEQLLGAKVLRERWLEV